MKGQEKENGRAKGTERRDGKERENRFPNVPELKLPAIFCNLFFLTT